MTVRDADITKMLPSTRQSNHRSDDLMDDDTDSARIYEIPGKWSIFVMFVLKKSYNAKTWAILKIVSYISKYFRLSNNHFDFQMKNSESTVPLLDFCQMHK